MIPVHLNKNQDASFMESEQRKYERFLVKDDIYAALRIGFKKVGKVHDISIKGMAFSYLNEIGDTDFENDESQVDIFYSGKGFHLFNVPCRIVYENKDAGSHEGFHVKMVRCGMQFGDLSKIQFDLLNFLIKTCNIKTQPVIKQTSEEMPEILNNLNKTILT
jgi:hypothetical protein